MKFANELWRNHLIKYEKLGYLTLYEEKINLGFENMHFLL